jgi:hypothetical protein
MSAGATTKQNFATSLCVAVFLITGAANEALMCGTILHLDNELYVLLDDCISSLLAWRVR